jgi:deoxyadenosine/deoxycytidine kinase
MTHPKPIRNICIIGNIGSGKSTLANLLGNTIPNSVTVPEDFAQNPFLPLYLKKHSRWAFANAVRYYYDYARVYHEKTTDRSLDYAFIDAGGVTNRFVYGRYLLLEKIMTRSEYAFYNQLCELIQAEFDYPNPNAFIFLESTAKKCFERMNKRGRKSQTSTLHMSYLVTIEHYIHMFQTSLRQKRVPFLTLRRDGLNFKSAAGQQETLALIRTFLDTYAPSL